MPSPKNVFGLGLLCFLGALPARAHNPLQGSTNLWLRPEGLEVEFVIGTASARHLSGNLSPTPITNENFSTYQPRLAELAPALFDITSNGATLPPLSINVSLTDELDVRFDLLYPVPASGTLRLQATFFGKMEEDFDNSIIVVQQRNAVAFGDQTATQPVFTINLNTLPPDLPAPPGPATQSAKSTPIMATSGRAKTIPLWTASALFVALLVLVLLHFHRHTRR